MQLLLSPIVRHGCQVQINDNGQRKRVLFSNQMGKPVSTAVKNLKVKKAEFDAALQKLIGTPPIRKGTIPKGRPWQSTTTDHPKRKPYRP
jgi:hypothetical protein